MAAGPTPGPPAATVDPAMLRRHPAAYTAAIVLTP
jgi:hypothetical protein